MSGNYSPYNRGALWTTGYKRDTPLYKLAATLNRLRNHAISIDGHYVSNHSKQLYLDGSTYATRKGPEGVQIVSVFSNQGSNGGKYHLALQGGFAPGTEVMEILGCSKQRTNSVGNITVRMGAGEPKVFFPISQLNDSGLCGFEGQKPRKLKSKPGNPDSSSSSKNEDGDGPKSSMNYVSVPPHMLFFFTIIVVTWLH